MASARKLFSGGSEPTEAEIDAFGESVRAAFEGIPPEDIVAAFKADVEEDIGQMASASGNPT